MRLPLAGTIAHALLAGVLLAGVASAGDAALVIEGHAPPERHLVEGEPTAVRAEPGRLVSLEVTYRPGSDVELAEALTIVDGAATWTPLHAGLARLAARVEPPDGGDAIELSEMVSVRFGSPVSAGLFVMIGAGLVLFGGAFASIRALLRGDADD